MAISQFYIYVYIYYTYMYNIHTIHIYVQYTYNAHIYNIHIIHIYDNHLLIFIFVLIKNTFASHRTMLAPCLWNRIKFPIDSTIVCVFLNAFVFLKQIKLCFDSKDAE